MPINISKVTEILNAKNAAANSSTSQVELSRLSFLSDQINDIQNAQTYSSNNAFPDPTVSNAGSIVFSSGANTYFYSTGSAWLQLSANTGAGGGSSYTFQGSNYGYYSGGYDDAPGADTAVNVIEKYSYTSDGNATDVGDLSTTEAYAGSVGQSSSDHGYVAGGWFPARLNVIQKFAFATDGNATDVGDLVFARSGSAGASSGDYGYVAGALAESLSPVVGNQIEKFSVSSDGNSTDVGDLTVARYNLAGHSSTTYGYASGGVGPPQLNTIDKYPFTSDGNATDVGDLTLTSGDQPAGQSSTDYGYQTGGDPGASNVIEKFAFASDGNATDVGDLTQGRTYVSGTSSTDYGFTSGGQPGTLPTAYPSDIIEKFPFASDTDGSDVGNLTNGKTAGSGSQY